jgi:hypothetical protein
MKIGDLRYHLYQIYNPNKEKKVNLMIERQITYLESIDDKCGLEGVFEISEAKNDFLTRSLFAVYQADRFKTWKGTKDI